VIKQATAGKAFLMSVGTYMLAAARGLETADVGSGWVIVESYDVLRVDCLRGTWLLDSHRHSQQTAVFECAVHNPYQLIEWK
jgi:hypothetical protein